jgi:exopolysaccharide biosynthesis protein
MLSKWYPAYAAAKPRTYIGYKEVSGVPTVVFAAAYVTDSSGAINQSSGITVFETYKILKYFGCTKGRLLDGGGSTKVRYKQSGTNTVMNGDGRKVYCQLALTASAAASCNWNG